MQDYNEWRRYNKRRNISVLQYDCSIFISLTYRIYMCYVVHKVSFAQINRDLQKT